MKSHSYKYITVSYSSLNMCSLSHMHTKTCANILLTFGEGFYSLALLKMFKTSLRDLYDSDVGCCITIRKLPDFILNKQWE